MLEIAIRKILIILAFLLIGNISQGQNSANKYFLDDGREYERIPFIFSGNQIIIKLKLNGSKPMSFILDSGVKTPIIIDVPQFDTLRVGEIKKIKIHGLGNGEGSDALIAYKNRINIGEHVVNRNQTVLVMLEDLFYLSNRLGHQINGIIGFDIFRDFVVEINYDRKYLKLYDPDKYTYSKSKKYITKELTFNRGKPYVHLKVEMPNGDIVPVKLLVDTGGSDALWLFHSSHKNIGHPKKYISDFLGRGLNGDIYGKRSRVKKIYFDDVYLEEVTTSYPDSASVAYVTLHKERNGSLGGGALSRFKVIIDYTHKKITFKKGHDFRRKFQYNMSGIELYMPYPEVPLYEVHSVRKGSPASYAGVKVGDVLTSINYSKASSLTLLEVMAKFQDRDGRKVRLTLSRNGETIKVSFRLKKEI
jgi:hypothetical protein